MKSVLFPAIALTATLLIGAGCCSGKTAQPDVGSTAAKEAQPDVGFTAEEADRFPSGGSKVLLSLSFEGKVPFDMPQGYSVVPAVGVNGTSALKFARQSNKVGEYIAIPIEGVVPGVRYQLRAKVRGKVVNAPGSKQKKPVVCGIEYRVNGKPREVLYPLKPIPENYEDFTMDFMARANGYEPNLVLYLWHDWSGEVFFDDVEIRSAGPDVSALLLEPANLTFRNGDRKFAVHIDPRSPLPAAVLVTLKQNGKTYRKLLTGMDERFNFRGELPELVPGEAELTFKVIDVKQRCTLHTGSFKVSMLPPDAKAPANAATFDRHGRLIVDGKPFMVLGVFGMSGETDLKRISEAGFNCLQLYASLSLQGNRKLPTTRENVISGMDLIQKYGLKLLFSTATQIPGHGV